MDERYRDFDKLSISLEMTLTERINALVRLGDTLAKDDEQLENIIQRSYIENKWFTEENQQQALTAIKNCFLNEESLNNWIAQYPDLEEVSEMKTIGIIMAGNIPLVGFHDFLCVFVAGHKAMIKLSDKDKYLLPYLLEKLVAIDARVKSHFYFTERFTDFQAVIATGSNNTARYFESYFSKYPNIIRKNRTSVAVLDGKESDETILAFGHDVFDYFGLGCRNVSKIYVPEGYNFNHLLEIWHDNFKEMAMHDKYKNNFDYNFALYMLNRTPLLNNGCLILIQEKNLHARIASLHYDTYKNVEELENELLSIKESLQCVSTLAEFPTLKTVVPGGTQQPSLLDYPDGEDVMKWCLAV